MAWTMSSTPIAESNSAASGENIILEYATGLEVCQGGPGWVLTNVTPINGARPPLDDRAKIGCGSQTRTDGLCVMSATSYQLLHPALKRAGRSTQPVPSDSRYPGKAGHHSSAGLQSCLEGLQSSCNRVHHRKAVVKPLDVEFFIRAPGSKRGFPPGNPPDPFRRIANRVLHPVWRIRSWR